jgi:hypothetical protein
MKKEPAIQEKSANKTLCIDPGLCRKMKVQPPKEIP